MEQVEVDFQKAMSVWWSITWRFILVSTLFSFAIGGLTGYLLDIRNNPEYATFAGMLGVLVSIPVGMWSTKAGLSQTHGGYSVVLVKPS